MDKNKIYEINGLMDKVCMVHRNNLFFNEYNQFVNGEDFIYEGLIKSFDEDYICDTLEQYFLLTNNPQEYKRNRQYQGLVMGDSSSFLDGTKDMREFQTIMLVMPDNDADKSYIEKFMEVCGWYKASEENDSEYLRGDGDILVIFEKKFQKELNCSEYDKELPNKLYHITQECYLDKILKNGLVPKSGNKRGVHPNRVYFLTWKPDMYAFSRMARQFIINTQSNEYVQYNVMRLLEVDISTLRDKVKFYGDPNAEGCVYSMDNILPSLIKVIPGYEIKYTKS